MKSEFDAKKFVQLFMAGYVPRSKDEKKFVDKHVAQLQQDYNGNKDDIFKAINIPPHKRIPYHGYEKGQDERMYEGVEQIGEMNKSAFSDAELSSILYHNKSTMRVKGYPKMNEPMDVALIQYGSEIVSEHEGEGGHVAQVRYSNVRKDYQVHHYTNGYNLGSHAISYHDNKKDAVDTAKYTTTVRNKDYLDRHEVLAGRIGRGSAYGVEPKPTHEILQARKENIKEATEEPKRGYLVARKPAEEPKKPETKRGYLVAREPAEEPKKPETKRGYLVRRDPLEEEMTDAQMAKRERIVKSMKKKAGTFKKRYGEKAEDVMYATATKMAMEDLDYVNLDMTDAVADLLESQHNLVGKQKNIDKNDNGKIDAEDFKILRDKKGLKHMENQAKKVREVAKTYPIAQRNESVISQLIAAVDLDEEIVTITFDNGEEAELERDIAESILNIFNDLSEENQFNFEDAISESIEAFEHALAFIAEAYEGVE